MKRPLQRYRKVLLEVILQQPFDVENYLQLNNQYWAIDNNNNVFFISSKPICGNSKRTVIFYIQSIKLPLIPYSRKYKHIIFLNKTWVLKPIGRSRGKK